MELVFVFVFSNCAKKNSQLQMDADRDLMVGWTVVQNEKSQSWADWSLRVMLADIYTARWPSGQNFTPQNLRILNFLRRLPEVCTTIIAHFGRRGLETA